MQIVVHFNKHHSHQFTEITVEGSINRKISQLLYKL